jgi:acyl carrier protein
MLSEELGRLNCLRQSSRRFQDLYDIIISTDPEKIAAIWVDDEGKDCSRSFHQFDEDIRAAAAFFRRRIGEENEGRFIALMMENSYHWSVAFWGLLMAGYKPVLLDVNHKESMVKHLLSASDAVAIVGKTEQKSPVTLIATEEFSNAQPDTSFIPRFANELALCTSGTTSTSKVYVFDEDAIVGQAIGVIPKITECPRLVQDVKDPVRHLAFLPMHHILGFMVHCILFPVVGKTVVYIKDRAPLTIQEACKRFRVTNLIVVPLLLNNLSNGLWKKVRQEGAAKAFLVKTLFALSNGIQRLFPRRGPDIAANLVRSIQRRLLGDSIRTILVGGSHIPLKTLNTINALCYYPMPGFGMTETGLTSFETRPQARYRMSGSTTLVDGISYQTVDANGNPSDVGELLIRGRSIHKARLIDGKRLPPEYGPDGWFRSGDIARIKNGGLYIEGRIKEIIITESGENVYPDELEDVFDGVSGVERICILSLANNTPNEEIALVFQLPENSVDPQAVAVVAAEILARNAKQPVLKRIRRLFVAVQPLPLANGIKVRRQKLKEWMETGEIDVRPVDMQSGVTGKAGDDNVACNNKTTETVSTVEEMNDIRMDVVRCFAATLNMEVAKIGFDKHFFDDLDGDSLDSLNLLVRLENAFGLIINVNEFRECINVNDVTRMILRKRSLVQTEAAFQPIDESQQSISSGKDKIFGYKIFYGLFWLIALLPFRCLYLISDLLYVLLRFVVRYRRNVIMENLRNSFPEKTEKERRLIARQFYHFFCDLIVETLKLVNINTSQINRRIRYSNPEIFDDLCKKGKQIFVVTGHYGNWEWTSTLQNTIPYHHTSLYQPLENKFFDKFIYDLRSRHGSEPIPIHMVIRAINRFKQENRLALLGFLSDQSPRRSEIHCWTTFLNQETPVYLGIEKLAKQYNAAVVYYEIRRVKRGYYEVDARLIAENAAETAEMEITSKHVQLLEETILRNPQYWLWSHRRWKHKK